MPAFATQPCNLRSYDSDCDQGASDEQLLTTLDAASCLIEETVDDALADARRTHFQQSWLYRAFMIVRANLSGPIFSF